MLIGTIGDNVQMSTLTQGDTLSFTVRRSSYPASEGWNMQFVLTLDGSKMAAVQATADGDDFRIDLASDDTAAFKLGRCQVFLVFDDGTQRFSESAGLLNVIPDPLGTMAPSQAQQMLTAIDVTIAQLVAQPQSSASFNGEMYTAHNLKDLYDIRNRLVVRVDREKRKLGIPSEGSGFKTIRTRFV